MHIHKPTTFKFPAKPGDRFFIKIGAANESEHRRPENIGVSRTNPDVFNLYFLLFLVLNHITSPGDGNYGATISFVA